MADTKDFHIGDILSVTDGHLVSPRHVDGVYDILNWMTGDNLFTHQLPRAARECEGDLRAQHPDLAEVVFPEGLTGEGPVTAWLAEQVAIYGETRPVRPIPSANHEHIDPLAEMLAIRGDAGVVAVSDEPVQSAEEVLLESLRWHADMQITNYDGDEVWLKPAFNEAGKRTGITDCCYVSSPCVRHTGALDE